MNKLTNREIEVITLIAQNKSNSEIAKILCISIHTVKAHVCSILAKFNALGRTQAALIALKYGYITLNECNDKITIIGR